MQRSTDGAEMASPPSTVHYMSSPSARLSSNGECKEVENKNILRCFG